MLFLLLACTGPDDRDLLHIAETEWIQDIDVQTAAAVPTVLTVTFTTPESVDAWVRYGEPGAEDRSTPPSTGQQHTHHLLGLAPLSEASLQIVVDTGSGERRSGQIAAQTGQLLPETPIPEVTLSGYAPDEHGTLLISLIGNPSALIMMGLDGTVHWSLITGEQDVRRGIGCQPAVEEGLLFYNTFNFADWGGGLISSVGLDGAAVETVETEGAHHFFERLPDGSLAWISTDTREWSGMSVVGDQVVLRQPDGALTTLFSTWDHLTVSETSTWNNNAYEEGHDWSHGNGLSYNPAQDVLLFSTGSTDVIAEITPTGTLNRLFAGKNAIDGDYTISQPQETFSYPHGAHYSADGELMMMSTVSNRSRLVGYTIDESDRVLRESWSYGEDLNQTVQVLGEVSPLPDGNRLVSWGALGIVEVVTPDSEVLWRAETSFGHLIGQVHYLESPYGLP